MGGLGFIDLAGTALLVNWSKTRPGAVTLTHPPASAMAVLEVFEWAGGQSAGVVELPSAVGGHST